VEELAGPVPLALLGELREEAGCVEEPADRSLPAGLVALGGFSTMSVTCSPSGAIEMMP